MKRLIKQNINTPEEYDRIFKARAKKSVNWADERRWKTLLKYYKGGSLIDLGCLDSQIIEYMPDKKKYIGVDSATEMIKERNFKYPYQFFVADIYKLYWTNGVFDYAVLGEVLEHLERPEKAIKESMRILRPRGGVLAVSVPLDESKEPGAVDGERHLWSFDETDIKNLLSPYGRVETTVLRSIKQPEYRYCWPQLVAWCWKGEYEG